MNNGWIKLYRKFKNWEWYKDIKTKHLFLHLLLSANHKDKKWQGIMVKRGQLITGLFSLSKQTGLSIQEIRTSLKKLKKTKELTSKATNKFSVITLINWEEYQKIDEQATSKTTNEQQTSNKRATTNKNIKNVKKREGNIISPSQLMKNFLISINNKTYSSFLKKILNIKVSEKNKEIERFASYWSELNKSGTKQKWELEKTFELKRRLQTWFKFKEKWEK